MTGSSKRKGDSAEREVCALLNEHLGVPARRAFGAGRSLDEGDIVGVPFTVVQVVNKARVNEAVREKPLEAEAQRRNAHVPLAASFVRLRGGEYRVVLTVEQWATYWREATNGCLGASPSPILGGEGDVRDVA